jgi:hypothetical protein
VAELLFIDAGPGASGSPDRFAPKYLVGNVPRGDSAVPYSAGGFIYFPDTGNGAGIAAALFAASVIQGDVWIRPGPYDMNLPGAPAGPFVVPDGCRLTGTGVDIGVGGPPLGQIIGRTTGDQGVFVLGDATALRDLCIITSSLGGPYAGSVDLIRCNGASQINNVVPISLGGDPAEVLRNVIGIYGDAPVEIDGMFAAGLGFNDPLDANWRNLVRVFNPDAIVSLRNIAAQNFDVVLWQDGGNLVASMLNVQMIGINRRGVYQAGGLPAFVSMDASCLLLAQGVDCIGAELWPIGGNLAVVSQITKARFYGGGSMLGPAILVHGDVAPSSGGRVRVQDNFALWARAGGSVIELGLAGSLEQCDRCSAEGNILMNLDVLGEGVRVSNANCNKNIIGGGSIEVVDPLLALVDFGTLTQSYPIAV